ncbi:MAG: N-acetyl-gamma-glutamyl-phosphate reductase [Oscillospiraceae bacterium]|nr:N-acetyl-gamma-glutamyl-phosphate reductase [Oscillospiraceae bacterium]
MYKIFIDGQAGTTGLRIGERLSAREDITLLTLPERLRKDPAARQQAIQEADAAILCLPDAAAREAAAWASPGTAVLDASTAHRTAPGWAYGFPELGDAFRRAIGEGRRISVPGCHAGGFVALVRPLIQAGLLPGDAALTCLSITGYTGGGKARIAEYESSARAKGDALSAPRQYALEQNHKHLPEMALHAGLTRPPVFCPVLGDYPCGMEVTVPLHACGFTREAIFGCYRSFYEGAAMVRVASPDNTPHSPNAYQGRDTMELTVEGNPDRLLLIARFDNLGKGASGAAVQCLNLALGAEETRGLVT